LKALLENYFKLSIIFWKNLFEKSQKSKYYFLAFNQLYASMLAKDCFTKFTLFYMDCFIKPKLSVFLNHYFINYYFTILERTEFKLYFYYFMQAKPLGLIKTLLLKSCFGYENMFDTVLEC
jgi:hypothetical protein